MSGEPGVEVWLADARVPDGEVAAMLALLDDDERRRHAGIVHAADRRRFAVSHGMFRTLVGAALGARPEALRWSYNSNGKPSLTGPHTGVEVSLTHSGDLLMVAVARGRAVGVDLQQVMPSLDCVAMARRFYPPVEHDLVTGAGAHERFAELWARKEAVIKAAGARLTRGLATPVAGPAPRVVAHDDGPFHVLDLAAPEGFRAAVALRGAAPYSVRQSNAATHR